MLYMYVYILKSVEVRNFLALTLTFVQQSTGMWIFSVLSSTF